MHTRWARSARRHEGCFLAPPSTPGPATAAASCTHLQTLPRGSAPPGERVAKRLERAACCRLPCSQTTSISLHAYPLGRGFATRPHEQKRSGLTTPMWLKALPRLRRIPAPAQSVFGNSRLVSSLQAVGGKHPKGSTPEVRRSCADTPPRSFQRRAQA